MCGNSIIWPRGNARNLPLRSRSAWTVAATSQAAAPSDSQPKGTIAIGTVSAMPRRICTVSSAAAGGDCSSASSNTAITRRIIGIFNSPA
jgi:hypothetical protein